MKFLADMKKNRYLLLLFRSTLQSGESQHATNKKMRRKKKKIVKAGEI